MKSVFGILPAACVGPGAWPARPPPSRRRRRSRASAACDAPARQGNPGDEERRRDVRRTPCPVLCEQTKTRWSRPI